MMYRVRDVVCASLGLLVLLPLFLLTALAIRLDSPGPVFFRQVRVGRSGRPFRIHKFRTMRVDEIGPSVSTSVDPRITRVGRFLRATKLDELPQLIDVLRGVMSLVGPRPEVPEYVALWPSHLRDDILLVRPGITDPATLQLRSEADILAQAPDPERTYIEEFLPMKAQAYADYVRSRSLMADFLVVFGTLVAVVVPKATARRLSEVRLGKKVIGD